MLVIWGLHIKCQQQQDSARLPYRGRDFAVLTPAQNLKIVTWDMHSMFRHIYRFDCKVLYI